MALSSNPNPTWVGSHGTYQTVIELIAPCSGIEGLARGSIAGLGIVGPHEKGIAYAMALHHPITYIECACVCAR